MPPRAAPDGGAAGLGAGDALEEPPVARGQGRGQPGLANQQDPEPPAAAGADLAPDPLAGLGQTNARAMAARAIQWMTGIKKP